VARLYRSFMDEKRSRRWAPSRCRRPRQGRAAKTHDDIARLMGVTAKSFGQRLLHRQVY
jgi:hypothetical protein